MKARIRAGGYLNGVSDEVWRKFKARAASEGQTIRALLLRWIQQYAEGQK